VSTTIVIIQKGLELLKRYGIKPKTVRIGTRTAKGYHVSQFEDPGNQPPPKCSAEIIDFDERAAILEFDGGLDRDEAEAQAKDELDLRRRARK
jgi:hypothetical protein